MDTDKTSILNSLFDVDDTEKLNLLSEKVIGAAFKIGNTLGHGFLEKVYENALAHELRKIGINVVTQREIDVR